MSENLPLQPNQILLTFKDKETADYVRLVCRRKAINLADYVVDNFEWDDQISCLSDLNEGEKITGETCDGCDHITTCPDAVKPKKARGRSR